MKRVCSARLCSPQFQGPAIPARMYTSRRLPRRFDGGRRPPMRAKGERGPYHHALLSAVLSEGGGPSVAPSTSLSLSVCLSAAVSPDMLYESDGNRAVRRTRRAANLPGHLARLTLFKQVPRRLVSCLVKWLTF